MLWADVRRGAWLTMVAVVLLSMLAIGCGGSSEAAPLKKAQFVKQGNQVCATMQAERDSQSKEAQKQLSGADEAEAMSFALEPIEEMIDELGELGPPVGQEKEVEAIIASFEQGVSQLEADPTGPGSVSAFEKADEKAAAYGLTECAI